LKMETISVELRGDLPFKLGGRRGVAVVQSTNPKIQKGWRVVTVNDQPVDAAGGADVTQRSANMLAEARKTPPDSVQFMNPLTGPKRSSASPAARTGRTRASRQEQTPQPEQIGGADSSSEDIEPETDAPTAEEPAVPPEGEPPSAKFCAVGALAELPPKAQLDNPQQSLLFALTNQHKKPVKTGPCDKCDGPHHADDCPHFKSDRDDHPDAKENYGKKGEASADTSECIINNAEVVAQPGDGSCMFHSLSYGLSREGLATAEGASGLRADVAAYACLNPGFLIQGTPMKDWILWDSGLSVHDYAARMEKGCHWGGAIELAMCSAMKNVNINVYERVSEGYKRITSFALDGVEQTIHLLYSGRVHYDALRMT